MSDSDNSTAFRGPNVGPIAYSNDIIEEEPKILTKQERAASMTNSTHSHDADYYGSKKRRLYKQKSFGSEMVKLSFTDLNYTVQL